jgi:hypothetical protein
LHIVAFASEVQLGDHLAVAHRAGWWRNIRHQDLWSCIGANVTQHVLVNQVCFT